jgi:hypothetical protein
MLCELFYPMKNFQWVSEHAGSSEGDYATYDLDASHRSRIENKNKITNHKDKFPPCLVMLRPFQCKSWKAVQRLQSTKVDENYSAIGASGYLARFYLFQNIFKQLCFRACPLGSRLSFSPDTVS